MLLAVRTKLFLGGLVDLDEIIVSSETDPHEKWAPHVMDYFRREGWDVDEEHPCIRELDEGASPFCNVVALQGPHNEDQEWAVAIELADNSMDNLGRGAKPITAHALESTRQQVKALIEALGLKPRAINLFPVLYVSS